MLTYSLKKEVKSLFIAAMERLSFTHPKEDSDGLIPLAWGKAQFASFIEPVKARFKVGDLVTAKTIQEKPNEIPFHYRVGYINELYHTARMDAHVGEPAVLHLETLDKRWVHRCPSNYRHLSVEECKLVYLSNQKAAGHA